MNLEMPSRPRTFRGAPRPWIAWLCVSASAVALLISNEAAASGPASGSCDEPPPADGPPPASTPWTDPALTPEQRTDLLLAQMTLEEKIDMATGELCGRFGFFNQAIPRLGIPALTMADGPAGVRINDTNTNQGRATALPAPIALAATWDVSLATPYGDVLGREAFLTGHNVLLGPAIDIARTPLAGRAFEAFGEDPYIATQFAPAIARAIQAYPVMANAKHFLLYTQETERQVGNVVIDERAMREIYVPPFEALVQADVASAMCSFNGVAGVPACQNTLMNSLLKGELGFGGFIMSDYGATKSTVESALAGLDQEQPSGTWFGENLVAAVAAGQVPAVVIDDKARRMLLQMFRRGLFDNPVQIQPLPVDENAARARSIAAQSMVLLKNADNLLPLTSVQSIAVVGGDAAHVSAQGGGSSEVQLAIRSVPPLEGITAGAGAGTVVRHAEGTDPVTAGVLLPGPNPVPSSVLTPAASQPGSHGLLAQYWTNTQFSGVPAVERVERQLSLVTGFVNFPGFSASLQPRLPDAFSTTDFSARWTGTITAPTTGDYTLTLTSLGSGWVYLDGQLVIDHGATHPTSSQSATIPFVAGQPREIRIDYVSSIASSQFFGYGNVGGEIALQWEPPADAVDPGIAEAAALAAESDLAIVFVRDYETEEIDRRTLALPNNQDRLIQAVVEANPRTIVVLMTGQPVTMPWLDAVPAVLQAWYPGQEQGAAVADVLFGDVNPSGKLPVTFPVDLQQTPTPAETQFPGVDRVATFSEGIFVGYRWYDAQNLTPLFEFGHGLSYTSFAYSDLQVQDLASATGVEQRGLRVSFTIANTGQRAGAEAAQVYVGELPAPVETPVRQLAGFVKVQLEPGASQRVSVDVNERSLSYWDTNTHAWVYAAGGDIPVYVGSSSRDVHLTGTASLPNESSQAQAGDSGDDGVFGIGALGALDLLLVALLFAQRFLSRRSVRAR